MHKCGGFSCSHKRFPASTTQRTRTYTGTSRGYASTGITEGFNLRKFRLSCRYFRKCKLDKILGRVYVPVVLNAATGALPFANVKRQGVHFVVAVRARFRTGHEPTNFNHLFAMPLRFVLQLPKELGPGHVSNGSCQFAILHHVFNA